MLQKVSGYRIKCEMRGGHTINGSRVSSLRKPLASFGKLLEGICVCISQAMSQDRRRLGNVCFGGRKSSFTRIRAHKKSKLLASKLLAS